MITKIAPIVTCQWLKQRLTSVGKNFKLLDASWNFKNTGKKEYLSKHIPGALFYDQTRCITPTQTLVRNVPDPHCYESFLRSLGVSADSHLVVYARGDLHTAARAWWTLRAMGHPHVSLLNGGIEQWEAEGGDMEDGETNYEGPEGNFKVKMQHGIMKTFKEITEMAQKKDTQLIDTRFPENFNGTLPEPSEMTTLALKSFDFPLPTTMNSGHVPGAINLHVSHFKTGKPSGTLKPKEELKEVFENAGIDLQRPLTVMCYNGLNACVPILAASVLGKNDAALYYGSWTDYGQRSDPSLCTRE